MTNLLTKSTSESLLKKSKNKNKERASLERSQEFEKHSKIHENLKVLYAYIKRIRDQPQDDNIDNTKVKDVSTTQREQSKSEREMSKRSEYSK